ncbi:hypothetical protein N9O57_00335 [bacterium]|nr:hypothetical protein [bacterium]
MKRKKINFFKVGALFVAIICGSIMFSSVTLGASMKISDSSFFLMPIESDSKVNSQIMEYHINDRIRLKGGMIRRNFRVTKYLRLNQRKKLEDKLDYIATEIRPDFILHLKAQKNELQQFTYYLKIYSSDKQQVFNIKETLLREKELKKSKIDAWIDEFMNSIPKSGTIEEVDDQIIKIRFNREVDASKLKGVEFIVTANNDDTAIDEDMEVARGIITRGEDDVHIGNIYSQNGKVRVGQRVLLLEKEEERMNLEIQKGVEVTDRYLIYNNPFIHSMRSCILLPIIGEKFFPEDFYYDLEEELADVEKCGFRKGSNVKGLLSRYGEPRSYLYNKEVLSLIAKKTQSGSLIRIKIVPSALGVRLSMDVVAENGLDIYFSRTKTLSSNNLEFIVELLKSWIHLYSDVIPYHGKVVKIVQGDKLLVDFGGNAEFGASKNFEVFKPTHLSIYRYNNLSHAKWKKLLVGAGSFEDIQDDFSVGVIEKIVQGGKPIEVGDWVVGDKKLLETNNVKDLISKAKDRGTKYLGHFTAGGELSRLTSSRNGNSGNLYSAHFDLAYYFSPSIHFYFDLKKEVSASDGFESSGSSIGAAIGTSYVPDFKFFPLVIDAFIGYRRKNFDLKGLKEPFLGELTFTGAYIGASVEFPVYNQLSILGKVKIAPFDQAVNSNKLLGKIKSANSRDLSVTAFYKFNESVGVYASYIYQKFESNYELDNIIISTNSYLTRFGLAMDF